MLNETSEIAFSSVRVARELANGEELVVVTMFPNPAAELNATTKDVRDLARVLSKSDPVTFGLLTCCGVVKEVEAAVRFDLIFAIPEGLHTPKSLRSLLVAGDRPYPLDEKVGLARRLASSVLYVYTVQFVHKNIRPETILVFDGGNTTLGASMLGGFDSFRTADGRTYRLQESSWEKDLYKHPQPQGALPDVDYKMQHDIYSFGVCLLEIGLWETFVCIDEEKLDPVPGQALDRTIRDAWAVKDQRRRAQLIKQALIQLAKNRLPSRMGRKYMELVVDCLTCLDKADNSFGLEDEFVDEDGVLVGVRFIEKVSAFQY